MNAVDLFAGPQVAAAIVRANLGLEACEVKP